MPASSDGVVTVTAQPAWASVRVDLAWPSAPVPWQTTVKRTNPDGTVHTVRSGNLAYTPGGSGYVYDHEAPLEGTMTYQAFGYSALGVLVRTSTVSTLVLAAASRTAWLKCLSNPSLSRKITVTSESESWSTPNEQFRIPGRGNPVVWTDVQSGISGELNIKTKTAQDYRDIRRLAGSGTLLLQGSLVDHAYDHDTYLVADKADPTRPAHMIGFGLRVFALPFTEVDRPSTAGSPLLVPGWTNDVVAAGYATYTAWDAAFATYNAQAKGP